MINEYSRRRIDYLQTEIEALKGAFGPKRILLTDDQRRRLAVKGKLLGRKVLSEIGSAFSPDTILRWHRELVAPEMGLFIPEKITGSANDPPTCGGPDPSVRVGESDLGL